MAAAKLDYLIGARNTGSLAASTGRTLILTMRNNLSMTFYYNRIGIRYLPALNTALIWMLDTQFNREVISGETQLCEIGQPNNAAYNSPYLNLLNYQPLSPGQAVEIYIQTFAGQAMVANDLAVTLLGYSEYKI